MIFCSIVIIIIKWEKGDRRGPLKQSHGGYRFSGPLGQTDDDAAIDNEDRKSSHFVSG